MFVVLSKILPLFIYPLGLAGLCLVVALLARPRRLRTTALVLALLLIWLGGNKWVASTLVRSLEWRIMPPAPLPAAPAIVVAGGGINAGSPPRPLPEVNERGDRLIYAAYLYKQGKAPLVLLSGGGIHWLFPETEAPGMAGMLRLLDVPDQAILQEKRSRNTYENALYSRQMLEPLGINRIILVTSALHMPRTLALYKKQGFDVIPAPTDYLISQADWRFLFHADWRTQLINLLPDGRYMDWTYQALKEYLGIVVYRLRGWL